MWPWHKGPLRAWIIQYFHLGSSGPLLQSKLSGHQLPLFPLHLPSLVEVTTMLLQELSRARGHVWASE